VSIREFWAERWNPAASVLGFGKYFFTPLARRGVGLGLFAAFLGSAVAHTLLLYMATKRLRISLMWGAFFLLQPLLIAAERRMNVRRWRTIVRRVWTLGALAITSPLLVEPALQLLEPTLNPQDNLFVPTVRVFGLAVALNVFYALGALASIRLTPPNRIAGVLNTGGPS
jgi:hypothetical protein